MTIQCEEQAHSFYVRFPYRADLVVAIKTIPGKQFRKDLGNVWVIPKTSERALRRFLAKYDGSTVLAQVQQPYVDPQSWVPTCTKGPPHYPHQLAALRFLVNRDAALLEIWMRLGKTRIIVDYVINHDIPRTLVVCPKTVIPVWPHEFAEWGGKDAAIAMLYDGTPQRKRDRAQRTLDEAQRRNIPGVVVLSYGALAGHSTTDAHGVVHKSDLLQQWCLNAEFDLLVLDEIQRAKAPGGQTALYLYQLASGVPKRIGLSGTPFEHSPLDAYGMYRVLDPSIFGTNFLRFRETYAELESVRGTHAMRVKRDRRTGREIYKNPQELRAKVDQIRFYAGANVLNLPPVIDTIVPVTLSEKAEQTYHRLREHYLAEHGDGVITAANAAVVGTRLQQITSGFVPTEVATDDGAVVTHQLDPIDTAKQEALCDILTDMPQNEPLVVFCRFHADLDAVAVVCQRTGRSYGELSGRRNDLTAWQCGETTVLITQIDAGAVGVRLDRANRAVYYSYTRRPGNYQQSRERLRHPSKTTTCFYDHLVVHLRSRRLSIDQAMRRGVQNQIDVVRDVLGVSV